MQYIDDHVDLDAYADYLNGEAEAEFIVNPSMVCADVIEMFSGRGDAGGYVLPWMKTHDHIKLRLGEVSIWAGVNGHGKSQMLGMVTAWTIPFLPTIVASLEMKVAATMHRMIRQVAGSSHPTEGFITDFSIWSDGKLWLYDQLDTVKTERIYGLINYSARQLGVKHVIIDSLMKCGIGNDDYRRQKEFVDQLCQMAKALDIHISLVHHMRKGEKEKNRPDKFDVKGAGEIVDLVDNLFLVHRNKEKEERVQAGEVQDRNGTPWADISDATLTCAKQRHGEWEGRVALWFHKESMQYTPTSQNRPMPYNFMEAS